MRRRVFPKAMVTTVAMASAVALMASIGLGVTTASTPAAAAAAPFHTGAGPGSELRQPAVDDRLLVSLKGKNEQVERSGEICRQRNLRPVQGIRGDPRKNCR